MKLPTTKKLSWFSFRKARRLMGMTNNTTFEVSRLENCLLITLYFCDTRTPQKPASINPGLTDGLLLLSLGVPSRQTRAVVNYAFSLIRFVEHTPWAWSRHLQRVTPILESVPRSGKSHCTNAAELSLVKPLNRHTDAFPALMPAGRTQFPVGCILD